MKTASIRLQVSEEQSAALQELQSAYAEACNRLVPIVREHRLWNRVGLHQHSYDMLRRDTVLGSQMCCNAIFTVCKAYKSQKELGLIRKDQPVPVVRFDRASIHFDKRTYTLKGLSLSLYTLLGRIQVQMIPGAHQQQLLGAGKPKEAELIFRQGKWYFNLVVEPLEEVTKLESGPVLGVDVGENNLAAISLGKVFGGEHLRDQRDRYLAHRRRLQSNGSQSAKKKLRQVSGKEARRVKHINHETSKAIVTEAKDAGVAKITLEDLTHIRSRIKAGKRMRGRLHRWAWRQLQTFVEYKAKAVGIAVEYVNPAYTSQTCSCCGERGKRNRHRFVCEHCGLRAHSDLNASRNLARIGGTAVPPRAAVSTPNVGQSASNN